MDDLIREYKKSLRLLRSCKAPPLLLGSMISDTEWAIDLMVTGNIPGTRWTVARWSRSKREIPCDPIEMARYIQNKAPISEAPEWMIKLLETLMSSLTALEKDAYELVRGRGYSFSQAGKILGCSKSTAQSYIERAEKKIRLAVRQQTISKGII